MGRRHAFLIMEKMSRILSEVSESWWLCFAVDTGIPVLERTRLKTCGTSGAASPTCRTWLNTGSYELWPAARRKREFTSSRCLIPATWTTCKKQHSSAFKLNFKWTLKLRFHSVSCKNKSVTIRLCAALLSWEGFQSLRCHRFPNMIVFMQEIDPHPNILKRQLYLFIVKNYKYV